MFFFVKVCFSDSEMCRSLLFTLLCGFAAAVITPDLDRHWDLWKKMHNKVYTHQVNLRISYPVNRLSEQNSTGCFLLIRIL